MRSWKSRSAKAVLALLIGAAGFAAPGMAAPLRAIAVETAEAGPNVNAVHLRRALLHYLPIELAKTPIEGFPPGSRLVIRLREVFLSSDLGGRGGGRSGFSTSDAVDGEALIVDSRGTVILRKSVAGRTPVAAGGNLPSPYNEPRRIDTLAQNFAYWIVRGLP